jgi:hypothetical protein
MSKLRLFDTVILAEDLPDYELTSGLSGVIVEVLGDGAEYLVEVFEHEKTVDVVAVRPDQIRLYLPFVDEGEAIVLTEDVPAQRLQRGDIGNVMKKHRGGRRIDVVFSTLDGGASHTITLELAQVRRLGSNEIAHVRVLE